MVSVVFEDVEKDVCSAGLLLRIYMIGHLAVLSLSIVLETILFLLSISGTLAEKGPRRYISPLSHFHITLLFAELVYIFWENVKRINDFQR
jgi:hypothetical protein